jgi:hypothetical protein
MFVRVVEGPRAQQKVDPDRVVIFHVLLKRRWLKGAFQAEIRGLSHRIVAESGRRPAGEVHLSPVTMGALNRYWRGSVS